MNLLVNDHNQPDNLTLAKLKDGSYFKEALSWYNTRYLFAFSESAWLFILLSILLAINGVVLLNIYNFFPLSSKVPIIIYEADENALNILKPLPLTKNESLQTAVGKYLVSNYVKIRESYSKKSLNYQYTYIKKNSSYDIYNQFMQKAEFSSLNSALRTAEKSAQVKEVASNLTSNFTTKALVKFNVIVNNAAVAEEQVLVEFRLSDVLLSYKKIIPLEFTVISYEKQ